MKECCVIGLGYIGLPTAAILCSNGHKVIGVDINKETVEKINSGKTHIIEKDLDQIVEKQVLNGYLKACVQPSKADVFIIAVPTPLDSTHDAIPKPNTKYVIDAVNSICPYLKPGNLVILESTSPVGTTEEIAKLIYKKTNLSNSDIHICYCPERVLPGKIIYELIYNDRVIGGINKVAAEECKKFYKTFCKGILTLTTSKTAELVKLSENAFRDVNIAFANELSMIADNYQINTRELISITNQHPRVNILSPSCGVGGHCIAVDPWFIISQNPKNSSLIKTARNVNNSKAFWVIEKIKDEALEIYKNLNQPVKIGIFGLAYKPNVDDFRESPALLIANKLLELNQDLLICEPFAKDQFPFKLSSIKETEENSDILVFLVAHDYFLNIQTKKKIVDFCGVLDLKKNTSEK